MRGMTLAVALLLAGCGGMSEQEWLAQRESLKRELLEELRVAGPVETPDAPETAPGTPETAGSPQDAQLDAALTAHVDATLDRLVRERQGPARIGTVEGRLLHTGAGLADARVRIVRWEAFRVKWAADFRSDDYYDTQTDAEGRYTLTPVEPGKYKLLWVPPGGEYWIRVAADKPDVMVMADQTAVVREIETNRELIGGRP